VEMGGTIDLPHDLLTVREVADYLRVSPAAVYGWLKTGVLPGLKIGGTWRVRRQEFLALISASPGETQVS